MTGVDLRVEGQNRSKKRVARELLKIALPITLSSAVLSLTGLIDTALIANCLEAAGFAESAINRLYSCYGNIAVPLFSLTPALIAPVAMASVPLISASTSAGDEGEVRRVSCSAIRLTFFASLPAAAGLSVFGEQIINLIFPSQSEAASTAAPLLSMLALSIVPVCVTATTNAILQARGRAGVTIISMLAGAAVKIAAELALVRIPTVNIVGAPTSTFLSSLTVACFNAYFLIKYIPGTRLAGRGMFASAVSAAGAVGGAAVLRGLLPEAASDTLRLLCALAAAVSIYAVLSLLTGAIDRNLAAMLPGGEKLAKLFDKKSATRLTRAAKR